MNETIDTTTVDETSAADKIKFVVNAAVLGYASYQAAKGFKLMAHDIKNAVKARREGNKMLATDQYLLENK